MSATPTTQPLLATPRSLQFALFVTGLIWTLASRAAATRAAQGLTTRLNLPMLDHLLTECFFLFLLLAGFALLSWISTRKGGIRATNALPSRSTASKEVQQGIAFGWAMILVAVLPMMLLGDLHPQFSFAPHAWLTTLLSLATLAAGTLAIEVAFRGYLYSRLTAAFGTVAATVLLSAIFAIITSFQTYATSLSLTAEFLASILLSLAYLRTRGLWFGWGLHFGAKASAGILLGMPVSRFHLYSGIVSSDVDAPSWITGGFYGPFASVFGVAVILGSMFMLYRITRDYAWEYTYSPIVAAGYAMEAQPPAAHVAMEASAKAAPAPLVQILGMTSTSASTMPVIDEHLRRESEEVK